MLMNCQSFQLSNTEKPRKIQKNRFHVLWREEGKTLPGSELREGQQLHLHGVRDRQAQRAKVSKFTRPATQSPGRRWRWTPHHVPLHSLGTVQEQHSHSPKSI